MTINANKDLPLLIVVTGPTATGKTAFAARLAQRLQGEVISADSRQVYRGMNLATGKDYSDYLVDGHIVPCHLVDIAEPGYEYSVYEFHRDFVKVYDDLLRRGRVPVLCGGTGLYIESVLKSYRLLRVPENPRLRAEIESWPDEQLIEILKKFKPLHNITDISNRKRLIRAIEIQQFYAKQEDKGQQTVYPVAGKDFNPVVFGIYFNRQSLRERITSRLKSRLDAGMVNEVRELLDQGLTPEQLKFYGLEYRYLTRYATGEISYGEMFRLLNNAIHQFAKRQTTWFRKMEREGIKIHWIDGNLDQDEKIQQALQLLQSVMPNK